jgi:hypothetical protein
MLFSYLIIDMVRQELVRRQQLLEAITSNQEKKSPAKKPTSRTSKKK